MGDIWPTAVSCSRRHAGRTTILLFVAGCELLSSSPVSGGVTLFSEQQNYSSGQSVELQLTNDTRETLFLPFCGTLIYRLERKEGPNWTYYTGGLCLALYAVEYMPVLQPGASTLIKVIDTTPGRFRYSLSYRLSSESTRAETLAVEFTVVE
jgi:hypothetical protein